MSLNSALASAMLGLLLLSACAPNGVGDTKISAKDMNLRTYQVSDLKDHPLVCGSTTCTESVGQLVTLTAAGFESCSFTLVTPSTILTAAHCVHPTTVNKDYSIQTGCYVRFAPKAGEKPDDPELEPIACGAVLEITAIGAETTLEAKPDYAYISLAKPSTRKPVAVSTSPFAGNVALLNLSVIDPGKKVDTLRSFSCAQDPNYQLSSRREWNSSSMILPDCPIHFGNSGGPILNPSTQEILGVVSFIDKVEGDKTTAVGSRARPFLK